MAGVLEGFLEGLMTFISTAGFDAGGGAACCDGAGAAEFATS